MILKKLKYQEYLQKFKDCPTIDFVEVDKDAYRWTHNPVTVDDFLPVSINEPQRILDKSDLKCMSYGLSMFDTLSNSILKYKTLYDKSRPLQKKQFIEDKGNFIALIKLGKNDGIADEPNQSNFGHFTFHEYSNINLQFKVLTLHNIFNEDGAFNI